MKINKTYPKSLSRWCPSILKQLLENQNQILLFIHDYDYDQSQTLPTTVFASHIMEADAIIAGHELVIKNFLDKTYKPSKHYFSKEVIKAKSNYLFQMMRLCEKVYEEKSHYERLIHVNYLDQFNNWYQWYERINQDKLAYTLWKSKVLYKQYQNTYNNTKKKYLDLIRSEYKTLAGFYDSKPQNIYELHNKYTANIALLIEASLHLIYAEDQRYSEFYYNYYQPFFNSRHEYKRIEHEKLQFGCFDGDVIKKRRGSGHGQETLNLNLKIFKPGSNVKVLPDIGLEPKDLFKQITPS